MPLTRKTNAEGDFYFDGYLYRNDACFANHPRNQTVLVRLFQDERYAMLYAEHDTYFKECLGGCRRSRYKVAGYWFEFGQKWSTDRKEGYFNLHFNGAHSIFKTYEQMESAIERIRQSEILISFENAE